MVAYSEASRIAQFIGLPKWQSIDDLGLIDTISKGFPVTTATTVAQRVDPEGRYFRAVDLIPRSTLHRREKERKPLSKEESEKLLALSKVFAAVLDLYHDDLALTSRFLVAAHPMLGARTPLEVAKDSKAGADLVLKILAKADAGVAA